MGFENIASVITKNAEAEAKKIIASAEEKADAIVAAANAKAAESIRAAKLEAMDISEQESSESITAIRLEAKKILDEARDSAVERALGGLFERYKAFCLRPDFYPSFLSRLVKDGEDELGQGVGPVTVYVRKCDERLISGYKLKELPQEYSGGAIVESRDGKIRVNKTLDEIFSQKRLLLRKKTYDIMF